MSSFLEQEIEHARKHNSNAEWRFSDNGIDPLWTYGARAVDGFMMNDQNWPEHIKVSQSLAECFQKYPNARPLAVRGWYGFLNKDYIHEVAIKIGEQVGRPAREGIFKINHTNHSDNNFGIGAASFFVGQILPDEELVVIDDGISTAGTFRDCIKYINSQGGKVVTCVYDGFAPMVIYDSGHIKSVLEKYFSKYGVLAEQFLQDLDSRLGPRGMNHGQLSNQELNLIESYSIDGVSINCEIKKPWVRGYGGRGNPEELLKLLAQGNPDLAASIAAAATQIRR